MNFLTAMAQAIQVKKAKENRKKGIRAYYNSGEVYLSRVFGYRLVEGHYIPDDRYAGHIRTIYSLLAAGKTLPEIKTALDEMKARDSSNNRYSISRIIAIAERPIYCGYLLQRGRLVAVKNLKALVSLDTWKQAQKTVKLEKKKLVVE